MPSSPQSIVLNDNEEEDNVPAQVSYDTQPSSAILEGPLPQDETPRETVTDPSDSDFTELAPTNEDTPQIGSTPKVGHRAPGFEMMGADGNTFDICDLDRPVLLNFWNSGCKPCRDEMRYLQKVYDERRDEGLLVIAINIGQSLTYIESFMEDNNLHIPVLFDVNATIARQYQVRFLPTSFFIDTDCIIQEKVIGSFESTAAIERKLSSIMPE
jgi:peroxiredoxin